MRPESRHLSVVIERPADIVYEYAADPANLPTWAAGLANAALEKTEEGWVADSPMGRVVVNFVERNDFGVVDHVVTLESGERVYNPLRVVPYGEDCEVVFTVRQRPAISTDEFTRDAAAVAADLDTLKRVLESR
ncbi:MAG: SRPBCC family protein [Micromonosporaceae bacterium]